MKFISSLLAMILVAGRANATPSENLVFDKFLDPVDIEYFATGRLPGEFGINATKGFNPAVALQETVLSQFNPGVLLDLYKLLINAPPKKLPQTGIALSGTVEEVKSYLTRSLLSTCPAQDILGFKCISPTVYSDVEIVQNLHQESLTAIAVHTKDEQIIVSYRGTVTIKNWITDFNYVPVDLPIANNDEIKVHKGFLTHFKSTQKESEEIVLKLLKKYPNHTLHITGYSLGAAVAALSTPYWDYLIKENNLNNKIRVFTYAGPRVGNVAFVDYVNNLKIPITRYTNRNDVVSHLPPRSYGYTHVGVEVHDPKPFLLPQALDLLACDQIHDESPLCGWKDRFPVSAVRHLLPMNKVMPMPPYY